MINIPVEAPVTEYLHAKAARLGIPLSGTFELTPCCNMACKMCYVRLTKAEQMNIAPLRSADEWIALGEEAKNQGMLYLLLTGGEPFMRPDFKQIFQGLHKLGLLLSINSNGTMIDEKCIEWLKETPPVRINITLYGASNETYEQLCGNPNGFSQTLHAIHLLKEAGISIRLNVSLTPHNQKDVDEIFALAKRENLLIQSTSYMFPPLRRNETMIGQNERFTPEEAAYQAARLICLQNGEEWFVNKVKQGLPPIPFELDDCESMSNEGEAIRCRAGKCSFWVTWKGDFMACGMLPVNDSVNVFDMGMKKAWDKIRESTAQIRLPAKCAECVARDNCKACAAMVYTETGNYHTVPKYRCEMTKAYPQACLKYANEITRKGDINEK